MKFFKLWQNNSFGRWDVNDKLCHMLVIEAQDEKQAVVIAENLGCYWDGVVKGIDCACCGDRWYPYPDEICLDEGQSIEDYIQEEVNREFRQWTMPEARLFRADGTVKEFNRTAVEL